MARGKNSGAIRLGKLKFPMISRAGTIDPDFRRGLPARLVNGVERGVTGRNWDGRSDRSSKSRIKYGALQFHDDDMVDVRWEYDLRVHAADTLASGIMPSGSRPAAAATIFRCSSGPSRVVCRCCSWCPTNTYRA